ncbi:MAG: sulfatase-like hydrolase/transferase [Verrucomicrobiota bacterium]
MGFDYHFGVPYNLEDIQKVYIENTGIWGLQSDVLTPYGNNWYGQKNGTIQPYIGYDAPQRVTEEVMNVTTDEAIAWILDRAGSSQPFFMNFASVAVHNPIEPTPLMRGTSAAGLYGDFIQDIDHSLGRLMDALDMIGELEDTVIIFVSDNGGATYNTDTPQKVAEDAGLLLNGNIRGDKAQIWEGGFKTPFIVSHINGKIPQGVTSDRQVSTVDLYATLADYISGETNNYRREGIDAIDSSSFKDALLNPTTSTYDRPPLVLRSGKGRKAIHFDNNWKYIEYFEEDSASDAHLLNLNSDPLETTNVISSNPAIGNKGQSLLDTIVNATGGSVY